MNKTPTRYRVGQTVQYQGDSRNGTGIILKLGTTFALVRGNNPTDMFEEWLPYHAPKSRLVPQN